MRGNDVGEIIKTVLKGLTITGKMGQKILQPAISAALNSAGFQADKEDSKIFLRPRLPVWRSKDNGNIEITKARRKIDIVVRLNRNPIALVETESDLNDLKFDGVTKRNGHYDVLSMARAANGEHFNSYKSLERMAAAAYYFYLSETAEDVLPSNATSRIEMVQSDAPCDHNPMGISLFLVTGSCRFRDAEILKPRLLSLGAQLISATYK